MLNLLMYYFCHTSRCMVLLTENPTLWRHLPQVEMPIERAIGKRGQWAGLADLSPSLHIGSAANLLITSGKLP